MRLLSKSVPNVTGKTFQKKYILLGRIVTQWAEIVGDEMAQKTQPVKLKWRKTPDKSKQFTMEVAANSAEATLLQYRTDLIIEKLNMLLGERMITAIRFVPISSNTQKPVTAITKPETLNPDDENYLSKTLENIEDPDIQEKLKSLGAAMLKDRKKKNR